MQNSEYWRERFRQLEEAQNRLAQTSFKEVEAQYRAAQKELEGKINTWYQRLAKNNNISMAQARRFLADDELEEFKWSVWDYIKHGKENALDGRWMKQLENASARLHISQYQALMIDTRQSFEQLFGKQLGTVTDTMGKVFENGYYRTAYELQKGMGIGFDVGKINRGELEKVLAKPWAADGKNFSERIWGNKEKLINEVHDQLTRNIITGADPQKAIDAIAKKMNASKSNAGRLVMTEGAYFSSTAQKDCFNELGVEKYEVVATLDSITSEICQSMDGKVFDMKDYQPGVTANPFHPNCRSTTCPHLDEELWRGSKGERAARGEDGRTYYVPEDMTYPEWRERFVDRAAEDEAASEIGDKIRRKFKSVISRKDIVSFDGLDENLRQEFSEGLNNALPDTAKVLKQQIKEADFAYTDDKKSYFNNLNKVVYLRSDAPASTIAHELFHRLDKANGITKNYGDKIFKALQKDWNILLKNSDNDVINYLVEKFPEAFYENRKGKAQIKSKYRGISDIISAMSYDDIMLGFHHSTEYWHKDGKKEAEAWAQFGRITYDNDPEVLKMFDAVFTNFSEYAIILLKEVI